MTHKIYEIWSEGYAATGERGTAYFHGTASGENFAQACERFFNSEPYEVSRFFDKDRLTYWACLLFPDEKEARKSYG